MQEENIVVGVEDARQFVTVPSGTTVGEVLNAQSDPDIVAGLITYDVVDLNHVISVPMNLSPIRRNSREGKDLIKRTQNCLLESILHKHFGSFHFQIGQSLQGGIYYELLEAPHEEYNLENIAERINQLLNEACDADLPIKTNYFNLQSACLMLTDERGSMQKLLDTWPSPVVPLASLNDFCCIKHGPMAISARYCKGMRVVAFPKGIILLSPRCGTPVPEKSRRLMGAYRDNRNWNKMIGVATVGDLNEAVLSGRINDVIRIQEGLHEKRIAQIADTIAEKRDKLRLICVAGPSSSGKTTFVKRLSVQLEVAGIQPVCISLDDYYKDRAESPTDADGKMNFEDLDALDVALLQQHLREVVAGHKIMVPRFDFKTGRRVPESAFTPLQLAPNQMLLIEGIHGLNKAIANAVPDESRFRIFLSALTQLVIDEHTRIRTSDSRLLRRIVRDRRYRGTLASGTIEMWPQVRSGEERNIFPFQENCDVMFNSSLIYESAVLKFFAWRYLLEVPREDPARVQAQQLLHFLEMFVPLFPDNIPSNSILREFIGGSIFNY